MTPTITKIKIQNFKRFQSLKFEPNERINVFIGDNEAGKSTLLEAIDFVASGNIKKIESIGIDRLMNVDSVKTFKDLDPVDQNFDALPKIIIELYLNDQDDYTLRGKNNSDDTDCDGIKLICQPNEDFKQEICAALRDSNKNYFPFEYYTATFSTFAGEYFTGYKRKIRSTFINSSNMNSEVATNYFIRNMYQSYTESDVKKRRDHQSAYRQMKSAFCESQLQSLNNEIQSSASPYSFGLKGNSVQDFEKDLMIFEHDVRIDDKGTGKQIVMKTNFALNRSKDKAEITLLEEPENHLSHLNLRKLIQSIQQQTSGQIFITTHSSLIITRLELRNAFILHPDNPSKISSLKDLDKDTANYFLKCPPANIVEFALSKKVILVEGPSEYILLDKFYKKTTGNSLEADDVHIMAVRGLSFRRYLELAEQTKTKVAVITDNDKNYEKNILNKYAHFLKIPHISIHSSKNNEEYTLEVAIYNANTSLCSNLTNHNADPAKYMQDNKTDIALKILESEDDFAVPSYIQEAIKWIKN